MNLSVVAIAFCLLLTGGAWALDGPAYTDPSSILYRARKGDLDGVKAVLLSDPTLFDLKDEQGRTPLHYAAPADHQDVIEFLLAHQPRPELVFDKDGRNPVHLAIMFGRLEVVEMFRKNRFNVFTPTKKGETPLQLAVGNIYSNTHGRHRELVKYFLRREPNPGRNPPKDFKWMVNVPDQQGQTALHAAAGIVGQLSALNALIDHPKADLNIQDNVGRTPLHYAVMKMDPRFVAALVGAGADVSIRDKDGRTAKDLAIMLTPAKGSQRESLVLIRRLVDDNQQAEPQR